MEGLLLFAALILNGPQTKETASEMCPWHDGQFHCQEATLKCVVGFEEYTEWYGQKFKTCRIFTQNSLDKPYQRIKKDVKELICPN